MGIHQYQLSERTDRMNPTLSDLTLLISHQNQVTRLPENTWVIASSDFCPYAAYAINDQVLCFQRHSESVHNYSRELPKLRQQHLDEELYRKGASSLARDHRGAVVVEWMMRFVACQPTGA